ncbi:MAG: hypothetical protein KJ757_05365 [Planctomycetes bacterium]|nr:hypothetical protein [Planctomycetota bacterium]MBU1518835.1 hypothetical protein [Planctomycetota bacterium]MBU2457208.1 hypothetical protein [Planctomycetota bacterium]MBU2596967.1 hypothetical protein [Planctomycetota bacterium]
MRKSTILSLICVALIVVMFAVKVSLSQNSTIDDPNQISDNQVAAEKIRNRTEEKDAQKKQNNIIQGLGQYVELGIYTPEKASALARLKGIDYSPEQFAGYLPIERMAFEDSEAAKQLKSKISDLESKYSNTLDSRVDDLESRINGLNSKYSDLDSKYSRLANRVNDLERKISTLELSR